MSKISFKWYLLQSVVMSIVTAISAFHFYWASLWFLTGLFIGLSVFNLLGWLQESLDNALLELNESGLHYVKGVAYRLTKMEGEQWTNLKD